MNDEAGQVAGVEGAVFGVLVFVIGTLVVANAWAVVDARVAAGSAAREGTRAFVESASASSAVAMAEAEDAAGDALVGYGRDRRRMVLVAEEADLRRCGRVALRVEYPVPLITIPVLGRYGRGFTAVGRHSEVVDPFRAGVPGGGSCPAGLRP